MRNIHVYTDGCAKPDGTSGIGWVIHDCESGLLHMLSQKASSEGSIGQRSLKAKKTAALSAITSLMELINTRTISCSGDISLFNDNISLIGDLLKKKDREHRQAEDKSTFTGNFFASACNLPKSSALQIKHLKRNKERMPPADALAALGASGHEIKGRTVQFSDNMRNGKIGSSNTLLSFPHAVHA